MQHKFATTNTFFVQFKNPFRFLLRGLFFFSKNASPRAAAIFYGMEEKKHHTTSAAGPRCKHAGISRKNKIHRHRHLLVRLAS